MSKANGGMIDEYTYDGVHPTDKGYEVMERIVLSSSNSFKLKPLLMFFQYSNGMQVNEVNSISHFRQIYNELYPEINGTCM